MFRVLSAVAVLFAVVAIQHVAWRGAQPPSLVAHADLERVRGGATCYQTAKQFCPPNNGGTCMLDGVCAGGECVNWQNVYYVPNVYSYSICVPEQNEPGDYYCSPTTAAVCNYAYNCYTDCTVFDEEYECVGNITNEWPGYQGQSSFSETSGCGQSS